MEKNNWNIDRMLHWLDIKIERENRDIAKLEKQMDGNFLYYFEWNAESLYKSHFMSDCYKKLRQAVDGIKDINKIRNVLKENAACCEKKLLDGQLDCRSSSRGANMVHSMRLECMQQLIKDYREFANILSVTPPEENQQQVHKTGKKEGPPEKKTKRGIRR